MHFAVDEGVTVRPGDMVTVEVTYAAPHHLVADSGIRNLRRTRAGDAWEARNAPERRPTGVLLGMPKVGAPEPQPTAVGGCCDS